MLPALINISLFRDAIERDCLILTPNQRLAAKIIQAWGEQICEDPTQSCSAWKQPRVYSVDHWLKACWDELQDQNHELVRGLAIVGAQQSHYYWERAIADDGLEQPVNFVKLAGDTLKTLENWNLSPEQVPGENPSVEYFKRWCSRFDELLRRNKLLTTQRSWQLVKQGFERAALPPEAEIMVYGFQSTPPLQAALISSASNQVISLDSISGDNEALRVEAEDSQQELRLAASWAAQELHNNPKQRIGIVVPELNNSLQRVARVVNEALNSVEVGANTEGSEIIANISAGTALRDTPMINSALLMIGLLKDKRPLSEWLQLLYSPYSTFDQLPLRFRADSEIVLRKRNRFDFSLSQFITAVTPDHNQRGEVDAAMEADSDANSALSELTNLSQSAALKPLRVLRDYERRQINSQQSFAAWGDFFATYLADLGWPGKRTVNSLEYQQRQHWNRLLEQFTGLDNLGIKVGFSSAFKHLQQLAQDSVFHPQTADAPLQILGLLEGSGLRFDQLWIVDMHSQNFPASVAINQLLPAEFQRLHQMPHSLPERELDIANKLLQEYKNNSRRLIVSYPKMRGEEQLDPSPLISDIALGKEQLVASPEPHPPWLYQDYQCQLLADQAPPYSPKLETIRGGSNLLKNQSICPFNAFASHRLKAEPLEEPTQGLSAMDRGSLLHEILFRLWGIWKSSSTLQGLTDAELQTQLAATIKEALTESAPHHPILRGDRFRGLEQQRLEKLLAQWLEEEKLRPPFEVVELESKNRVRFGDLEINLRLDRVDKIADKLLIIDYKSGAVKESSWSGSRPVDPQLPLYVLASKPQANGCAFAQIKGGKIKFVGSTDSKFLASEKVIANADLSQQWAEQIDAWQTALNNLADEFVRGHASVEVYDQTQFGYQDYLLPLNRWSEEADINAEVASSMPLPTSSGEIS
ncbi:PD-(D/E)XK nuclease family protein [SAR92 clade bacterium H455]|uniref:PD-(D/E)XK nuclease family protein n=1 Tax=SAR92 clade bacterium H455 TaxID=2974818 RepID=A0ABY5TJH9_9GAMM|nr:PD-(D/E)XK nuclease family protein [SAR92 clade bacterium H455]